jgi:hypothetical protein
MCVIGTARVARRICGLSNCGSASFSCVLLQRICAVVFPLAFAIAPAMELVLCAAAGLVCGLVLGAGAGFAAGVAVGRDWQALGQL